MTPQLPTRPHTVQQLRSNAIAWPSARAYQVDPAAHFMDYIDPASNRWGVTFGLTVNR